jgi:hypothetical protein
MSSVFLFNFIYNAKALLNVLKTGPEIEPEKLLVHGSIGSTGSTIIESEI